MFRKSAACVALIVSMVAMSQGQQSPLIRDLLKNRYQLSVQNGRLTGAGAAVIETAVAPASFVLLGEDHGIAQLPQFESAVCDLTGAHGFHTMAIETGATVARELEGWVSRKDRVEKVAAFEKQFPVSMAIYNMTEENQMLAHCAAGAKSGKMHLWGLDQEFLGSAGFLLGRIEATHPGKAAAAAVARMIKENDQAYKKAEQSHNPLDLFMLSGKDEDFSQLKDLLKSGGSAEAQSLLNELLESRKIYREHNDLAYDGNRRRAILMKQRFLSDYEAATRNEGAPPKVLLKFGAIHLYKGFNLLRNNDIGNFVTELADGRGNESLHIFVLAVKGSQLRFAGVGLPYQPGTFDYTTDKDSPFLSLKPIFENLEPDGWTLFDLRALRRRFESLGPVETQLERMIFGYDLLVIVPVGTPASQIQ